MKKTKIIAFVALSVLLYSSACGQSGSSALSGISYSALNNPLPAAVVNTNINTFSGSSLAGSLSGASISGLYGGTYRNTVPVSIFAASEQMKLNYGIPLRVALDQGLLYVEANNRLAELIDLQDYYRNAYSGQTQTDLVNLVQKQIDPLIAIQESLSGPDPSCFLPSFQNYKTRITAEVKYKDLTHGVGLMRAENGNANLSNIPVWEISGQTKTSLVIYRK